MPPTPLTGLPVGGIQRATASPKATHGRRKGSRRPARAHPGRQAARATAKKLSDKTSELNAELAKAEEAIAALRVGVRAAVVLEIDEEEGTETHLCFERHEGKWSLTIRDGRPELEDWSTRPLLKASRRRRMEAAKHLPALVDDRVARIESEIGEVERSIGATQGFIKRLRSPKA